MFNPSDMLSVFVLVAVWLMVGPAFGVAAYFKVRHLRRRIEALGKEIAALRAGASGSRQPLVASVLPATPQPRTTPPEPAAPLQVPPPLPAPSRSGQGRLEETVALRWFVWLGGIALALSGIFLVKYGIEAGLLGPRARVGIGFLLGVALIGVADRIRRQPAERQIATSRAVSVPTALAAAGVVGIFASLYAAYGLYDLVSAPLAFASLGVVAMGAVALSLNHGPFLAGLGVAGAYVVPLLVASAKPAAVPLFLFLLAAAGTGFGIARHRQWDWVAWLALAGAAAWPLLWLASSYAHGDAAVVGAYLLLVGALATLLEPSSRERHAMPVGEAAAITVALDLFALVRIDGYGVAALLAVAGYAGGSLLVARQGQDRDVLPPLAAVLIVALMALWHQPDLLREPWQARPPVVPPEFSTFVWASAGFAALLGGGGYGALWGARRPGVFASVSAWAPPALLATAYLRLGDRLPDLGWAGLAAILGLPLLAAAERVARRQGAEGPNAALAAYAVGIVACVSLALTMALTEAWLSVALALQLPALAWVDGRLPGTHLRKVAFVVAAVVLVRLALNPDVLHYPLGGVPGLNWIAYGYGVPAVAFLVAARRFGGGVADRLVLLLQAGALAFAVVLIGAEIRTLVNEEGLRAARYSLLEQGLQSSAWLAVAIALYAGRGDPPHPVAEWGWRVLGGLAAAHIVVLQLAVNPLWRWAEVGALPLANALLPAYLVPGLLAGLFARLARRRGEHRFLVAAGMSGLMLLTFVWLSLEVRRHFHGGILAGESASQAEVYAYSLAWLFHAGALLAAGLRLGNRMLRLGSLVVVLATVAKVFVIDAAGLSGLYRAVSFFGLGLCLVGVGYLYQRYVFGRNRSNATGSGDT